MESKNKDNTYDQEKAKQIQNDQDDNIFSEFSPMDANKGDDLTPDYVTISNIEKQIDAVTSKKKNSKKKIESERNEEYIESMESLMAGASTDEIIKNDKPSDLLCIEIKEVLDSLHLTKKEKDSVDAYMKKVELDPYIIHIIPKCGEKTCIFQNLNCPFIAMGKQPLEKPCPLAMGLAMNLREQWIKAISSRLIPQNRENFNEYNSVQYDIVIYRLIVSLVESDLYDIMMDNEMSIHGLVDLQASCIISRTGNLTYIPGESAASIIHEKVQARRDTILKQLLLTPEISAKYKLINKTLDDSEEDIDELKAKVMLRNKQIAEEQENMKQEKNNYGALNEYKTIYERTKKTQTIESESDESIINDIDDENNESHSL